MKNEKTGIELIAEERKRQVEEEGWTPEHDSQHKHGELARAAACYALPNTNYIHSCNFNRQELWPWNWSWWKPVPEDRIRELQKAGALIAAEIDRIKKAGCNGLNS